MDEDDFSDEEPDWMLHDVCNDVPYRDRGHAIKIKE